MRLARASQIASPSSNHKTGYHSAGHNSFSISYSLKLAPSHWEPPEGFSAPVSRCSSLGLGVLLIAESTETRPAPNSYGKLWLGPSCLPGSSRQPVTPSFPDSSGPDSSV